jgi:hypothetical protein
VLTHELRGLKRGGPPVHTLIETAERLETIETHLLQVRDDLAWLTEAVERSTRAASNALERGDAVGEWREPLRTIT